MSGVGENQALSPGKGADHRDYRQYLQSSSPRGEEDLGGLSVLGLRQGVLYLGDAVSDGGHRHGGAL
jgi:hypothetical protein